MTIAKNTAVKIKNTNLTGTTNGAAINDDGTYLVSVVFVDAKGKPQSRYFAEEQLEV